MDAENIAGEPVWPDSDDTQADDELPEGFHSRDDGIYHLVRDKKGGENWVWVCSPLRVLALARNDDSQDWGLLVEVTDPDGLKHPWALPLDILAGSGELYRRELLSLGLRLAPGFGRNRLDIFLSQSRPSGRVRGVSRTGWHGKCYVLPDAVFGQTQGEQVVLQTERPDNQFKISGLLPDWQEQIGRYCVGNSRLVLYVSAALAAPLLYLAGGESGGLHLVGGSSLGKTTALDVAGSVCGGGGVRGYRRQWRATANGLESIAAAHCDALLCLDELSQVEAREAAETAYMLGNGCGKARATRTGGARKPSEWRTLFLSTGELTLADKIREDGRGRVTAGQAVRVVDIAADAGAGLGLFEDLHGLPTGHDLSRHLTDAAKEFYGQPLRAFLERLTAEFDAAAENIHEIIKDFIHENCPPDADGQVKRVCARFGLVAAGGELGAAYGVLPWPKGEATQTAARCFRDWLSLRGGSGASEEQAGLDQVRAFILAHGSSRFEAWADDDQEPDQSNRVVNRAGFRRLNANNYWEYYIPVATFKGEIARGHDAGRLAKFLARQGLILPDGQGRPSSTHRIPGQPVARYYHFDPRIASDSVPPEPEQQQVKPSNFSTIQANLLESDGKAPGAGRPDLSCAMPGDALWTGPAVVTL
jgi:uncharacterized protein (DUF927 family)